MLFNSMQFAIFFPIVLALSWALMSRPALWKPFIVLASYIFYAAASPRFCLLLGGVTVRAGGAAATVAFPSRFVLPAAGTFSLSPRATFSLDAAAELSFEFTKRCSLGS